MMPVGISQRMAEVLINGSGPPVGAARSRRVINTWMDEANGTPPLRMNNAYHLSFNVDYPRNDFLAAVGGIDELAAAMPPDQDQLEVMILLEAESFTIRGPNPQRLMVSRRGASNAARFAIEPVRGGTGGITALCFIDNHLFQKMEITLHTTETAGATQASALNIRTNGFTLENAVSRPISHQNMSIIIIKREAGYQFVIRSNSGTRRAFVNISESQIADLIAYARDVMHEIVNTVVERQYVYQQEDITIPVDVYTDSLRKLAELGTYLYEKLFYSDRREDVRALGDLLRTQTQSSVCDIEIIAEHFVFPWALLYDREYDDPMTLDGFWGFKHSVACLPEFNQTLLIHLNSQITVDDKVNIGLVCNTKMDHWNQIARRHGAFLHQLPNVSVSEYPDCQSFLDLLKNSANHHHILYFYCHAVSNLPGEEGGVGRSKLILSDGDITLIDMDRQAPARLPPFAQAPLVFLNACASAKLSPYMYDGFVPYLLARGARGVLGTEVDMPIFFGAEFGGELLKRFIAGQETIGALLVQLRREFALRKNNLLGLLYTLYSSGDITIKRG